MLESGMRPIQPKLGTQGEETGIPGNEEAGHAECGGDNHASGPANCPQGHHSKSRSGQCPRPRRAAGQRPGEFLDKRRQGRQIEGQTQGDIDREAEGQLGKHALIVEPLMAPEREARPC